MIVADEIVAGTLLGMLAYWLAAGSPHYVEMGPNQRIAYISDVGATFLKPLFIAGSATMVVVFDLAFISERWLRHKARLTPTYSKWEAFLSVCGIIFAIAGAAGLILLSIFDTKHYPKTHDAMLGLFIGGYVISAIFICAEYQRLGIHFRHHSVLRNSFWLKLAFIIVELSLAIAFGVTQYKKHYNVSAILEWIIALIYIFYVWSFIIDFLPATKTKHPDSRFPVIKKGQDPNAEMTEAAGNVSGGPVYSNGGHAEDANGYGNQSSMADSRQTPSRNF